MFWRYAKSVLAALSVIILVGFSLAAVVTKVRHGQLLSVQSGSMVPHFHKGDLVNVTRVPASPLKEGDIITFISPVNKRQTITHRIVETPNQTHPGQFVTKGDANPAKDRPIPVASVIGRAGWSVPYLGYAADFIRQPIGLFLIIYIPAISIVWSELVRLAKYYEKQRPYVAEGYIKTGDLRGADGKVVPALKFLAVLILAAVVGLVAPVHALLMSRATLQGNTISTVNLAQQTHLEISELFLRCSGRNTQTASRMPLIMLYNPSGMNIKLKNWTLRDNSGVIMTFPNRTIFKHQIYIISLYLPNGGLNGLQYVGDHLGLYTDAGQEIDGLSWGNDVSEFDPSIQGVSQGTNLRRTPITRDTNTASDWKLRDIRCAGEEHHDDHDDDSVHTGDAMTSNSTTINIQINNGSKDKTTTVPDPSQEGAFRIAVTSDQ